MRIKLPENFGASISYEGETVDITPDADGCVDAGEGLAQALLTHGGSIAPDPVEENAKIDEQVDADQARIDALKAKKSKVAR
jgi:hypothetical protein